MTFETINEKEFLNPYYRKKPILEIELNEFIKTLRDYKTHLESNLKNNEDSLVANALSKFFENLDFECEVKSIHKGNSGIDLALKKEGLTQVIIEAKLPYSKEFFNPNKPNCKALHECILYYLRERKSSNSSLKYIIITNFYSFYIFKANLFEELFNKNEAFKKAFENFENKNSLFKGNTDEIYKEFEKLLASSFTPLSTKSPEEAILKGLFIDLKPILEQDERSFSKLKILIKIFNKACLLNEFNPNDANLLNEAFYRELLYILGLCESKQKLIKSVESEQNQGTLYTAINSKLQEEDFESILKLLILWLNRILFLKLIESNLVRFNDDKNLKFLTFKKIPDFERLSELFFEILAQEERKIKSEFAYLPYLNSSLFEKQDIEKNTLEISSLSNDLKLTYYKFTILKDENFNTKQGQVGLLEYLFEFLDSFDFGSDDEQSEILSQKELISSSVLGNVFEKLNGYKEGSFYTPSFITSYMCKESLVKIVLDKFNARFDLNTKDINELRQALRKEDKKTQKELLNSVKICDPAVGSGHFLVSALNAMLSIYDELNLFEEEFYLEVQNDEILITNRKGDFIEYKRPSTTKDKAHLIQQELFYTKKTIIENNLFGVDINPNSCEITKLRLWIELLKNSFYESFDEENFHNLQTLPNIDINIKCGNSLLSKMPINEPLHLQTKQDIKKYKKLEEQYYNGLYENRKEHIEDINTTKNNFIQFYIREKYKKELNKLYEKCEEYAKNYGKFALDDLPLKYETMKIRIKAHLLNMFSRTDIDKIKAKEELEFLKKSYDEIYSGFEWRVEFSKILYSSLSQEEITQNNHLKQQGNFENLHKDKEGDFIGFDLIISNPPYIRQEEIKDLKPHLAKTYKVFKGTSDIYTYFYELGFRLLNSGGVLSFITSNKYTRAKYGEALREFLLKNTKILEYTDLNGVKVFSHATVDTSILRFEKSKSKDNVFKYLALNTEILKANKYRIALCQENSQELPQKSLNKEYFNFNDESVTLLKAKIERIGTPLKDWYGLDINYGIKTGFNEAFIISTEKRKEILANCKDKDEKKRTAQLIHKILRGRDIKRYGYKWAGLWIINIHNGYRNEKGKKIKAINIENYPSLKKHLDEFYPQLEERVDKGKTAYNLRNCAYMQEFEKEKIVYSEIVKEPQFYLDTNLNFYAEATSFVLTGENLKYLIAFLNNSFVAFIFKTFYAGGNLGEKGFRYKKAFLEKLPIPKINSTNQKTADELVNLVDAILKAKEKNKNANTQEFENKIDTLVYKLYNLNDNEINLIESNK